MKHAGDQTQQIIDQADASLLDIVDHILNQGVVISGDVVIGVADVDLIYLGLSVVLCSADRVQGRRTKE
jgi:gas vesicle structural protein